MPSHFPLNSVCSEVKEDEDEKDEDEEEEDGENQANPCIRISKVTQNNQFTLLGITVCLSVWVFICGKIISYFFHNFGSVLLHN